MEKPRLVLFDGHALVHRAFHALPPLTVSKTGEMVGAVYGFALIMLKAIDELKPSHYAIAFDKKGPTFRHKMFPDYKAHRPPTPDELVNQMGRVRELVETFHIPIFELDEYEADDLLGALSRQASREGIETVIVTGDADANQLVSPQVKVFYPKRSFSDTALYDEDAVVKRYGIEPKHIADLKGLQGDSSDNIPGVPGIGEKTAVKLIQQFGSIEEIYDHIDQVAPPRLQEKLRDNEEIARQSKVLATIVTEAPVTLKLDDCRIGHYDRRQVAELLRELEFASLLPRLPASDGEAEPEHPRDYHTIDSAAAFDKLIKKLAKAGSFAFDLETTSLDAISANIVGVSLSAAPGEAYYIPVGHVGWGEVKQLPLEKVVAGLKPLLGDDKAEKMAHNGKYDMTVLAGNGIEVRNLAFDTMIAAHLLGEKGVGLKTLAFSKLGVEMTPITDLIGSGRKQISMSQVEVDKAADYACADADNTARLAELFRPQLQHQGLWKLFSEVEMPLVPVLTAMERNGVALDTEPMRQMSRRLGERLIKLEKDIYGSVSHQFNINSPQQLSCVLFEELKLPAARKTKGGYSTGAAVLEELKGSHPIIEFIMDYRQLSKLKSTYIDTLPGLINPNTGRVHTSFNQTKTATGRLSSSDPNLQNIPIRGKEGQEIRKAFIAPSGCRLLAGDYSQIDLRSLAHLSGDPRLLESFRNDEDIHAATAAQLYGVDASQVTKEMRRLAKTVNFGVIYGMSEYGLEQATELSREEAAQFIAAYFERYPGVKRYLSDTKEQARQQGYVHTLLGRKRFIPEITSPNRQVREAAERMAINMPVQGTSADIIKVAMVNLHRQMAERRLASKLILQVHDELVFEVPDEELDAMRKLVPETMSAAIELSVPVKVDVTAGANWGEMA